MRRATLIFNPRSGRRRSSAEIVPALIQALAARGVAADCIETTGPGTAGALAASAARAGADIVFACGGDGTVHEVTQGIVGTSTALGVIPMGTANALARNLGLSTAPLRAVVQQATAESVRIPVGQVRYRDPLGLGVDASRYFTVMAGAGPDGALVYSLTTSQKSSLGRTAYYAHAARLFATREFHPFRVMYRIAGPGDWQEEIAVGVMSARIGDLGGIFGGLTRGCSLYAECLRLVLIRPPGRIALPAWFVFGQLGMECVNPLLRTLEVAEFRCESISEGGPIHSQVDGEWIGGLPISVSLMPDALSLLVPRREPFKPSLRR